MMIIITQDSYMRNYYAGVQQSLLTDVKEPYTVFRPESSFQDRWYSIHYSTAAGLHGIIRTRFLHIRKPD